MWRAVLSLAVIVAAANDAGAQTSGAARKAARELVDFLRSRFAREVAEEGAEKIEQRFARVIDDVKDPAVARQFADATRRLGPKMAMGAIERHGAVGARIFARHGENGARLLVTDGAGAARVFGALGDEGVDLMIRRHGQLTAARLPDLAEAMAKTGRHRDLLAVLEKHGDRACSFIWRNKGVIFTSAVLASFLANPKPYIDGVVSLTGEPVRQIAASTDWTALLLAATALVAGLAAFRMLILRPSRPVAKPSSAD